MSKTTTTAGTSELIESEEMLSSFSDKTVDYFIRIASEGSSSDEEKCRKLIELVVEAMQRKRNNPSPTELATNYASANTAFAQRITEAREVAFNTLQKMTHGIPSELEWANTRYGTVQVTGIYRYVSPAGFGSSRLTNIESQIASGKMVAEGSDDIHFYVHYNGKSTAGQLPLRLLTGDPMLISQYVRKLCKNHRAAQLREEEKQRVDEQKKLVQQQKNLERQLAKLNKEVAAMEAERTKNALKIAQKAERLKVTA